MEARMLQQRCLSRVRFHMSPAHLIPLHGLEKELELLSQFCIQSEVHKESHAILLVGPHNTGKSLVLRTALRELEAKTGSKPTVIFSMASFIVMRPQRSLPSDMSLVYTMQDARINLNQVSLSSSFFF